MIPGSPMETRHSSQRGDIVLVPFPFTDLTTAKQRPALVISTDLYHSGEPDIILAAITSQMHSRIAPTDYRLRDWRTAGLLFPSIVKSLLVTVGPRSIRHRIGRLSEEDMAAFEIRLRRALGL